MSYGRSHPSIFQIQPTAEVCCMAGNMTIPGSATANYSLSLGCDDGGLLYIDGKLVINNNGAHHAPSSATLADY